MLGEIQMKKILIIMILIMNIVGCELFDAKTWEEADKRWEERGRECYQDYYGSYHCKDTK